MRWIMQQMRGKNRLLIIIINNQLLQQLLLKIDTIKCNEIRSGVMAA
jgi:hypothetical protein